MGTKSFYTITWMAGKISHMAVKNSITNMLRSYTRRKNEVCMWNKREKGTVIGDNILTVGGEGNGPLS